MQLIVKLFGPQAVRAGTRQQAIEVPQATLSVGELRALLAEVQPALADSLPTSRFAINCELSTDSDPIAAGDEVALLGMMSGG